MTRLDPNSNSNLVPQRQTPTANLDLARNLDAHNLQLGPTIWPISTSRRRAGSVKVPAGARALPPAPHQHQHHQHQRQTQTQMQAQAQQQALVAAANQSSGNAKYLRYVRSKFSKSRLNSVLSMASSAGSSAPSSASTPCASAGSQCSSPASSGLASSAELGAHQNPFLAGAEPQDAGATSGRRAVGPSLSSGGAGGAELGAAAAAEEQQQQQQKSKKSTFFQGFRYTLRGRRGSKAAGKRDASSERPAGLPTSQQQQQQQFGLQVQLQQTTTSLASAAQMSSSQSLSSISANEQQQQQQQQLVLVEATQVSQAARELVCEERTLHQTTSGAHWTHSSARSATLEHKLLHLAQGQNGEPAGQQQTPIELQPSPVAEDQGRPHLADGATSACAQLSPIGQQALVMSGASISAKLAASFTSSSSSSASVQQRQLLSSASSTIRNVITNAQATSTTSGYSTSSQFSASSSSCSSTNTGPSSLPLASHMATNRQQAAATATTNPKQQLREPNKR